MTIVEFVRARLDEEERVAKNRDRDAAIHSGRCGMWFDDWECDCDGPAEVLRRVDALRTVMVFHGERTVDEFEDGHWVKQTVCKTCFTTGEEEMMNGHVRSVEERIEWPCPTVYQLARIWADHPDYQPEWSLT